MQSKLLSLALFLVAMLAAPGASHAANDEQQIRKIEHEWLAAITKRDGAFLQRLEAADFTVTGPGGKTLNKAGDIKDTTSGETTFENMTIDRLKVRFYGDTAIASGLGTVKAHTKEKDLSGKYSWTDVFVKMNGEWKAVAAHVTAVSPEKK
jgi:ketosteroid isomerase-like protein